LLFWWRKIYICRPQRFGGLLRRGLGGSWKFGLLHKFVYLGTTNTGISYHVQFLSSTPPPQDDPPPQEDPCSGVREKQVGLFWVSGTAQFGGNASPVRLRGNFIRVSDVIKPNASNVWSQKNQKTMTIDHPSYGITDHGRGVIVHSQTIFWLISSDRWNLFNRLPFRMDLPPP
jgi:hypothetical protein